MSSHRQRWRVDRLSTSLHHSATSPAGREGTQFGRNTLPIFTKWIKPEWKWDCRWQQGDVSGVSLDHGMPILRFRLQLGAPCAILVAGVPLVETSACGP